jgi:hypothetical protein
MTVAGCSSGAATPTDGAAVDTAVVDAASADQSSAAEAPAGTGYFITVDVDGVTQRVDADVVVVFWDARAWIMAPMRTIFLGLEISDSITQGPCTLTYRDNAGGSFYSDTCMVTVTVPAANLGDVMEGTFAGTLTGPFGPIPSVPLTNGRFRAPRAEPPP